MKGYLKREGVLISVVVGMDIAGHANWHIFTSLVESWITGEEVFLGTT